MKIELEATGNILTGDVLDVARAPLERALRAYDDQLYLKWNAKKNFGYGSWELRRRPNKKTIVETIPYGNTNYHVLDYKETDIENHVFDIPYLSYEVLTRLKKADMWAISGFDGSNLDKTKRLVDSFDGKREEFHAGVKKKAHDNAMYELKQDKAVLNQFRNDILSGLNPSEIAKYWK